ncbi:MAG TPA: hypothetical protein VHU21_26600, partial [Paraburkholderia sp.]|nr:hypothetical protein [Paraburkholderia sp.]
MNRSVTAKLAPRAVSPASRNRFWRKTLDFYRRETNIRTAYTNAFLRLTPADPIFATGALMSVPQQAFLRDAMRRMN